MKWFRNLVVVVSLLLGSCIPANASDSTDAVAKAIDSTVSIQLYLDDSWRTVGSGVTVRKHGALYFGKEPSFGILTAQHVAEVRSFALPIRACAAANQGSCVQLNDYIVDSEIGYSNDWAIFLVDKLPKDTKPALIRRGTDPRLGEDIVQVGYPWGNFFVAKGVLGAYMGDAEGYYFACHGFAAAGSSGGGVWDQYGRLIGLTIAREIRENVLTGLPEMQEDYVFVTPIRRTGL